MNRINDPDYFVFPTRSLFKQYEDKPQRASGASMNDVNVIQLPLYAVTVNIANTKKVNRKVWGIYTQDEQRKILARVEASFRKATPSVELVRIEYEVCPSNKNVHFHALYRMPDIFVTTVQNYWRKFDSTDSKTLKPWRHLDIQLCHNVKGWLEYITKDKA